MKTFLQCVLIGCIFAFFYNTLSHTAALACPREAACARLSAASFQLWPCCMGLYAVALLCGLTLAALSSSTPFFALEAVGGKAGDMLCLLLSCILLLCCVSFLFASYGCVYASYGV